MTKVFIVKAAWRNTAKLLRVRASSQERALDIAERRRDIARKGCESLTVVSWRYGKW